MANGVGVPPTSNVIGGSHEISGDINLSGMLAKDGKSAGGSSKGSKKSGRTLAGHDDHGEFSISAGDGAGKRMAEFDIPIHEKLTALGLQATILILEVAALKADRGGQLLVYPPKI
jgi:hypothetical protein